MPAGAGIVCAGCKRRVGSNHLVDELLRSMTGYQRIDGTDWCPECAAALRTCEAPVAPDATTVLLPRFTR